MKKIAMVEIYQIKNIEECDYAFRDFDRNKIKESDYKRVFKGEITLSESESKDTIEFLDRIFFELNISISPKEFKDFTGRSISTSDIIVVDRQCYYCNSIGWENVYNLAFKD